MSRLTVIAGAIAALAVAIVIAATHSGTGLTPFARQVGQICTDLDTSITRSAIRAGYTPGTPPGNVGGARQELDLISGEIPPAVARLEALRTSDADQAASRDRLVRGLTAIQNLSADIAAGRSPLSAAGTLQVLASQVGSAAKHLGLTGCSDQALT